MIVEELEHGAGCGASERKVVAVPPLTPGQLHQRSQREGVNGAFRHSQPGTLEVRRQQSKIVPLVAALHVHPKIVPCPPQTGEPGTALHIPANKDAVLVAAALIERPSLDTRLKQIRVDAPSLQIGQHHGREPAGPRERKGLRRFWRWPLLGRRRTVAAQGLHRAHKVHPADLDKIVQRRPAPYSPTVPAPFPVGDFKAVMGPGAVFMWSAPFQLTRLIGLQIRQQVPFFCFSNLFFCHSGQTITSPNKK